MLASRLGFERLVEFLLPGMLKELIDQFYLDREKAKDREQTRFYITDAGRCPRSIFFKFKKAPIQDREPRILRMFEHGDYIHRLILNTLFSLGLVRSSEIDIPPQEIIGGRADAILSLGHELYVLDIKSSNSFIFKGLSQPKEENVNQLQLYLHFFGLPRGILLYVNKDTQELKEFAIDYNVQRAKRLLADLDNLKEKIESNFIPERLANYPQDKECQFCQFRLVCGQAGEKTISWDAFKAQLEKGSRVE